MATTIPEMVGIKPRQRDHLQKEMNKHAAKILFFLPNYLLVLWFLPADFGGNRKSTRQKVVPNAITG
jgi:hypothetical protein